jgi:uncharacterized repeat protein (TIGR01451 family)
MPSAQRENSSHHASLRRAPRLPGLRALLAIALLAFGVVAPRLAAADPASPLVVTKSANPSPVASGQQLTYTITTVNTGGSKVDNVVLTDQVNGVGVIQTPPALPQLVLTSSKGTCSQGGPNGNVVTCNAGALASGEQWTVTIRGQVTASNGTTINNTASVTGTRSAQNFTTNATVSVLVQNGGGGSLPDLTLNKTGPSSVPVSSPITYTLTVNNTGAVGAASVRVVDTVPAGVTGISASGTSLFTCALAGQTVTCTGGAVNAGANATITISGMSPPAATTLTNTAVVDPLNAIAEANELNNTSATVNTSVGSPPAPPLLEIKKTDGSPAPDGPWGNGAGPDPVIPGQKITYKILVKNNASGSNSRADDVVVTDGTHGLEAASITVSQVVVNGTVGNGNGCVVNAPQVRCSIRTLNAGGTLTVTIAGTVIASAGSTIFNTATVTGNIKNTGVSHTASEATTVQPAVDLTITKADAPDPVCARSWPNPAGEPPHLPEPPFGLDDAGGMVLPLVAAPVCLGGLTYTLVVGNSGLGAVTGVTVRDPLPAGVLFDSYHDVDAAGFVCALDEPTNVVTCAGGTVPPASTVRLKLLVAAPPGVGPITNTATVDPNNAIFEADETNNAVSQSTGVVTGVDLVVWKSDSNPSNPPGNGAPDLAPQTLADGFDPIATRGTETYTLVVDNVGTQDVTGIRLRDTLPTDTIFLSAIADPAHGFTCSHDGSATGGVVECVGGHLLGTAAEFYDPAGPAGPGPGDDVALVKIKLFARSTVGTMHNEVRVDPLGEIAEANELNNLATDTTTVTNGDDDLGAFNELSIDKTQTDPDEDEVATSSVVTYQIVVTNNGTDPAVDVKVRDFLPAGFQFVEATDVTTGPGADPQDFFCNQSGSVQTGIVVTCSGATLDGTGDGMGAGVPNARTIQIKATSASQPGSYTNQALVDPDGQIAEGNETNNSSSVITKVKVGTPQGFVDLTIAKCDEPSSGAACAVDSDPVAPIGEITYVLTVTNLGTDPAFNVVVRDVMPAGTTFVSAEDVAPGPGAFTCGLVGGFVDCTGGTLDGTADLIPDPAVTPSRTIKVVLRAPNANTTVTNQAFVDPANAIAESDETNNSASQTTTVTARRNLTLDKQGPDTAHQNDEGDYEITIKNEIVSAPGEAVTNVKVIDTLPVGLIPLTWSAEGNFTCQLFENPVNTLECVGDLAPDQQVKISIHVFITQDGGAMDNEACIDPDDVFTESTEADNCDTKTTVVFLKSPDLFVNKTADKATVSPGELLNYTITLSNDGDASADAVELTDALDVANLEFQSAIASNGFTCAFASPNVTCSRAGNGLAPGEFTTITIQVKVKPTASGTIANSASVPDNTAFDADAPECEPDEVCANEAAAMTDSTNADNQDSVTVSVGASGYDLAVVSLDDAPDPVAPGGIVTYTAIVSNNGTSDAAGVQVRTELTPDSGITLTHVNSAGSNGFACTFAVTVDCTGNLPAGGSTTVTMQFQVAGTVPPDKKVDVTTTVDPAAAFAETDETNNVKSNDTTVHATCSSCVDLVVGDILDTPDPVARGSVVTYVVGVGNAGDTQSGAFDIRLTIGESGDVDFGGSFDTTNGGDDYTATAGFACTALGDVVTCNDSAGDNDGLAPGEGVLITLKVRVKSTAVGDFANLQVEADPTNAVVEFSDANNDGTESTAILP